MITNYLLFILLNYGIINIAIYGSIFESWRNFWVKLNPNFIGKLVTCPLCLSFWCGVFLSNLFFNNYSCEFYNLNSFWVLFLDGCIASGGVWLIHTIQYGIERYNNPDYK